MTLTGKEIPLQYGSFPSELLLPTEMGEIDRRVAASPQPGPSLMDRAGEAVAQVAARLIGDPLPGRRIVMLCGPGNNGGDGFVAARFLAARGFDVRVGLLGVRDALKGDAATAAERWMGPVAPLGEIAWDDADLVIDAMFGAGLARDLGGVAKGVVERLNAWQARTGRPILAVDMPSGIDGASGTVRGASVAATACVTFFRLKPGHILLPGRLACGRLALADIGIDPSLLETVKPQARLNAPALWVSLWPVPAITGHKYLRGHAVVVSGPLAQTGAARLAARGALRAGAGLVTVLTPADALAVHAAALTAIMTRVCEDADDLDDILSDGRKNVVVLGPGLGVGQRTRDLVLCALASTASGDGDEEPVRRLVLDADALASFAKEPETLFAAIASSSHATVLTPHDGEFAKLFGSGVEVGASKLERTRAAAGASGATVVLKGADTIVAEPGGRASIAAGNAPWLATAGSGDVLGGMIGGLLAQGMPVFEAASAAVWMHAEAARLFGPGLISEDIADRLPQVLASLLAGTRAVAAP